MFVERIRNPPRKLVVVQITETTDNGRSLNNPRINTSSLVCAEILYVVWNLTILQDMNGTQLGVFILLLISQQDQPLKEKMHNINNKHALIYIKHLSPIALVTLNNNKTICWEKLTANIM